MDPTTATGSIVYGVVAGVVTSFVIGMFSRAVERVVLPWYRDLVYQGVRVDGKWMVSSPQMSQTALLDLKQAANRLTGSCVLVAEVGYSDEYETVRPCIAEGKISDRFVELSFRHVDRSRLGAGVYLFEVVGDGRKMEGIQSFYSVETEEVSYANVVARREAAALVERYEPSLPFDEPPAPRRRRSPKRVVTKDDGAQPTGSPAESLPSAEPTTELPSVAKGNSSTESAPVNPPR